MINNQVCKKMPPVLGVAKQRNLSLLCYLHNFQCAITTMSMLHLHDYLVLNTNKISFSNSISVKILQWQYNNICFLIFNIYSIQISVFNHQLDRIFFYSPSFFNQIIIPISSLFQHLCLFHLKHIGLFFIKSIYFNQLSFYQYYYIELFTFLIR